MGILVQLINLTAWALEALIIAYVILSYVVQSSRADWAYSNIPYAVMRAGRAICEPMSRALARAKVRTGALDLSPMLTWMIIEVAQRVLIKALIG